RTCLERKWRSREGTIFAFLALAVLTIVAYAQWHPPAVKPVPPQVIEKIVYVDRPVVQPVVQPMVQPVPPTTPPPAPTPAPTSPRIQIAGPPRRPNRPVIAPKPPAPAPQPVAQQPVAPQAVQQATHPATPRAPRSLLIEPRSM